MTTGGGAPAGRGLIEIEVDIEELRRQLQRVTDQVEQNVGQQESQFSSLAGTLKGTVVGAVAAVGAALVATAGKAVAFAQENLAAQNKFQSELGVTAEEAKDLGETAKKVFANNFGGSLTEAAAGVAEVKRQVKGLSDNELQGVTEAAFSMRDAFGIEVAESTNAVNTLMKEFGLTSKQATDFLTAGLQKGMNASGDFLDTIGEYSVQFKDGGATADEFFSLLESGLKGGMLGTDKAADAFKEFRVRIQDGSEATADSLAALGINSEELAKKMASGQVTAADAFQMVLGKLRETKDENVKIQAGVGLLGTQFEDLGQTSATALDMSKTKMKDLAGATDSLALQYNDLPNLFAGVGRQFLVSLEPAGAALLKIGNQLFPLIQQAAKQVGDVVTPIITAIANSLSNVGNQATPIGGIFQTLWKTIQPILQSLWELLKSVADMVKTLWLNVLKPTFEALAPLVEGAVRAAGTALKTIVDVLKNVVDAVNKLLKGDFSGALSSMKTAIVTLVNGIIKVLGDMGEGALKAIKGFVAKFSKAGADLIQGLIDGMKANVKKAVDTVSGLGDQIIVGFKNVLGIKSPSRVMHTQGEFVVEGLINGIQSKLPNLDGVVQDMAARVAVPDFSYKPPAPGAPVEGGPAVALDGVPGAAGNVVTATTEMSEEVKRQVDSMAATIEAAAASIQQNFQDIFTGVVSAQQGLANVLADITRTIVDSIVKQIIAQQAALAAKAILDGAWLNFAGAAAAITGAAAIGGLLNGLLSGAGGNFSSPSPSVPGGAGSDRPMTGGSGGGIAVGNVTLARAAEKMDRAADKFLAAMEKPVRVSVGVGMDTAGLAF